MLATFRKTRATPSMNAVILSRERENRVAPRNALLRIARPMKAWILFAHGSSDPDWAGPMRAIETRIAQTLGSDAVALAFLERQAPTLDEAVAGLLARGFTQIIVIPMFLGIGGHLKRDLPEIIDALRTKHRTVDFQLAPPIGESRRVADAIVDTVLECGR